MEYSPACESRKRKVKNSWDNTPKEANVGQPAWLRLGSEFGSRTTVLKNLSDDRDRFLSLIIIPTLYVYATSYLKEICAIGKLFRRLILSNEVLV